jgi:alpha-tubulin suppressor-like RCC1 family protein
MNTTCGAHQFIGILVLQLAAISRVLALDYGAVVWGDQKSDIRDFNQSFVQVSAGTSHTVAVRMDGTVIAWGSNQAATVPTNLTNIRAVAAGASHTVALKMDGTVVAWGDNQLAILPPNLTDIKAVAAGASHTLALKTDGTILAWGSNNYGQTTTPANLTNVSAIAAGYFHAAALKNDGTVVAWGRNNFGQTSVPFGLSGVTAIAAGGYHTIALKSDGTVVAWGGNDYGQAKVPANLTNVKAITAGEYHTVALKSDGTVVAWGVNWDGEVSVPSNLTGIKALTAGGHHTVALKNNGSLVAWGGGDAGQSMVPANLTPIKTIAAGGLHTVVLKEDGTVTTWYPLSLEKQTVPIDLGRITDVAAGGGHTLALKADGTVAAWGSNLYGQTLVPASLNGVKAIAAGGYHCLALKLDGTVVAWGARYFDNGQVTVPENLIGVVAIAAGGQHSVALKKDGTVVAWGANECGQTTVPANLTSVMAVAAGDFHTVALKIDGTVVAWGANDYGQSTPPANLKSVSSIAAGANHTICLKKDGTVVAWGDNRMGQTNIPLGLAGVKAISAGIAHTAAIVPVPKPIEKPKITNPGSQQHHVGQLVSLPLVATLYPTKFIVKGLPKGLLYDAVRKTIYGQPTSPLFDTKKNLLSYTVKITPVNLAGNGEEIAISWKVLPLPSDLIGSFGGLVTPQEQVNNGLGGLFSIEVSSTGAVTGKISIGKTLQSFKGNLHVSEGSSSASFNITIPNRNPSDVVTLNLILQDGQIHGSSRILRDGGESGLTVWRRATSPPVTLQGTFNAAMQPINKAENIPEGTSWITLKIGGNGIALWSGRMGDGSALTASNTISTNGLVPLFTNPYKDGGIVRGWAQVSADNGHLDSESGITWIKNPEPASSKGRLYKSGIPEHTLTLIGSRYALNANGLVLDFSAPGPGIASFTGWPLPYDISQDFELGTKNILRAPQGAPVKLTLNATNGAITSNFSVLRAGKNLEIKGSGLVVPRINQGIGHILVPQGSASTDAILSAKMLMMKK